MQSHDFPAEILAATALWVPSPSSHLVSGRVGMKAWSEPTELRVNLAGVDSAQIVIVRLFAHVSLFGDVRWARV